MLSVTSRYRNGNFNRAKPVADRSGEPAAECFADLFRGELREGKRDAKGLRLAKAYHEFFA